MSVLKVDEKWSITYDPADNDRPRQVRRHGEHAGVFHNDNLARAMFYALLAKELEPAHALALDQAVCDAREAYGENGEQYRLLVELKEKLNDGTQ